MKLCMRDLQMQILIIWWRKNPRLGLCLNNYYEEEIFPEGNIEKIILNISDDKLDKIEGKFRDGITRYIKKELLSENVCEWLAKEYEIPVFLYKSLMAFLNSLISEPSIFTTPSVA